MLKGKSILVVHSDSDVCLLYKKNLELNNYHVSCFETSKEAYDHITDNCSEIALIIWDIWTPGKDWKDLLIKLKENEACSHVKIILSSTEFTKENKALAKEYNIDGLLKMPFKRKVLIKTIEDLFSDI